MTAQVPAQLDSRHDGFLRQPENGYELTIRGVPRTWAMYGAVRGDPSEEPELRAETARWSEWILAPPETRGEEPQSKLRGWCKAYKAEPASIGPASSANWKGYVEQFRLTTEGRLILLGFTYDRDPEREHRVDELLEGDFFMMLKQSFFSPGLYVPFRDGVLVTNHTEWLCAPHGAFEDGAEHEGFRPFDLSAPWMPAWLAFGLDWY